MVEYYENAEGQRKFKGGPDLKASQSYPRPFLGFACNITVKTFLLFLVLWTPDTHLVLFGCIPAPITTESHFTYDWWEFPSLPDLAFFSIAPWSSGLGRHWHGWDPSTNSSTKKLPRGLSSRTWRLQAVLITSYPKSGLSGPIWLLFWSPYWKDDFFQIRCFCI